MQFIVVEQKEKDLYTIYDVVNKGVCCCSLYTLKQLLEMHHEIIGVTNVNGKLRVQEMTLEGKTRNGKAPIICEDTTKRSAVTIAKGLPVKQYPRVIQKRKFDGAQYGTNTTFTVNCDGKGQLLCMKCTDSLFIMQTGKLCKFSDYKPEVFGEVVTVSVAVLRALQALYTCAVKRATTENEIARLTRQLEIQKGNLKMQAKDVQDAVNAVTETRLYDEVNGAEEFDMSFFDGTLNRSRAIAIIKKTKRKILYTHGLSYRNPTINKQPITVERAISIVSTESLVDVRATKDAVYINTYSDNDMF